MKTRLARQAIFVIALNILHSISESKANTEDDLSEDGDRLSSGQSVTSHDSSLLRLQQEGAQQGHGLEDILGDDHTQVTIEQAQAALASRRGVEIRVGATDAGGIRGVIPVKLWRHIEQTTKKKIHELFDWLTGSSTGAIVSIALAAKKPVEKIDADGKAVTEYVNVITLDELLDLYTNRGEEIFSGWSYFNPKGVRGPIYQPEGKMGILDEILGDLTMLDVFCDIAVPFFDWKEGENIWYTSVSVREGLLPNIYLRDLAHASSAPMLYFAAHPFESIDGSREFWGMDPGTYLPNTALHALDIARARDPAEGQFLVVSMGTGKYRPQVKLSQVTGTSLLSAASLLLAMDMRGSSTSADSALECQLNREEKQYYRFDPYLGDTNPDLDNVKPVYIEKLRRMTRELIRVTATEMNILCTKLVDGLTEKSPNLLRFELLQMAQNGYIEGVEADANNGIGRQGYGAVYGVPPQREQLPDDAVSKITSISDPQVYRSRYQSDQMRENMLASVSPMSTPASKRRLPKRDQNMDLVSSDQPEMTALDIIRISSSGDNPSPVLAEKATENAVMRRAVSLSHNMADMTSAQLFEMARNKKESEQSGGRDLDSVAASATRSAEVISKEDITLLDKLLTTPKTGRRAFQAKSGTSEQQDGYLSN